MKKVQIFKKGTHTAMNGTKLEFTEAVLVASARVYDPAVHEAPLVVGHPHTDDPAFGWVESLSYSDADGLQASPHQINADFEEMVAAGSFKKISASFYTPDHPSNPVPGNFYLKHVGFLGATAPAVKGLRAIEFADDDKNAITIEIAFGEHDMKPWTLAGIGRILRGLRDRIIETDDLETADRVVPAWEVESVESEATRLIQAHEKNNPAFAAPPTKEKTVMLTPEEIAAKELELKNREEKLATNETNFGERDIELTGREKVATDQTLAAHHQGIVEFADQLVTDGKLLASQKERTIATLKALPHDAASAVEFAEGTATIKETPFAAMKKVMEGYPKLIEFGEVGAEDGHQNNKVTAEDYSAPVNDDRLIMHNKALAYAEEKNVSYEIALNKVQ